VQKPPNSTDKDGDGISDGHELDRLVTNSATPTGLPYIVLTPELYAYLKGISTISSMGNTD